MEINLKKGDRIDYNSMVEAECEGFVGAVVQINPEVSAEDREKIDLGTEESMQVLERLINNGQAQIVGLQDMV